MKFTIFQSDKGDCLLLESDDGKLILSDGGMSSSYQNHVAPALARLRDDGREVDVAYVSHIDQDHIAGILALMDNEVAWRVFEHQRDNGNTNVRRPRDPRPAKVRSLWHNAFHEQVGENAGEIGDMLAASASILAAARTWKLRETSEEHENLALSKGEAVRLSRRAGARQLGIPLNEPADGKLLMVRDGGESFDVGRLKFYIIGPFNADLTKLRSDWNDWLQEEREQLLDIQRRARRDEENLGNSVESLLRTMEATAEEFGNREHVTAPNLASLMFYVEEPREDEGLKRFILTGDGHCDDILKGLRHHDKLDQQDGKGIHVDVLKGQHHGAKANWNEEFVRAVTADHYIFCGNGAHNNPEKDVLDLIIDSRIGPADSRSSNAEVDRPFTIWFNSSEEAVADDPAKARHMRMLKNRVTRAHDRNNNVRFRFLERSSFGFSV